MAWNGLGQYILNPTYDPEANGDLIDAVRHNGRMNDLATGITACLAKNGENVPTANLPMGGYRHTGAAAAIASGQYVTYEQAVGLGIVPGTIPQNSQSAAYTLVLTDAGKHIFHPSADTTARIWTIPANSSVAFPIGTVVTFVNQDSAGVITIAITTDTMRLAGAGTTGSRTLAANGLATAIKVTSTEWLISGTGLS